MYQRCDLAMPKTVWCKAGSVERITELLGKNGRLAAVVTDQGLRKSGALIPLLERLEQEKIRVEIVDGIAGEPDYHQVQAIVDQVKTVTPDLLIGVGGGSVIDTAKLASILIESDHTVYELLKDPGLGKKTIKTIVIPTTAGTGAEATPNGIVAVPEEELKVGIVNTEMIPDHVILDPEMLRGLPRRIAASTGVDALSHGIECFTSKKANPFSDLFALESADLIFRYIERMYRDAGDMEAAEAMMRAAFYAGVAITSSGTTAVHALSYPLGGKYHIAHGTANAMLLGPVMSFNCPSCSRRLARIFDRTADQASGAWDEEKKAKWVIERLEQIIENLKIPKRLSEYGIGEEDLKDLIPSALKVTRLLDNNCRNMTPEDVEHIYRKLM